MTHVRQRSLFNITSFRGGINLHHLCKYITRDKIIFIISLTINKHGRVGHNYSIIISQRILTYQYKP